MTDSVSSQAAYVALTDLGLSVSGQAAYLPLIVPRLAITSETSYVALIYRGNRPTKSQAMLGTF